MYYTDSPAPNSLLLSVALGTTSISAFARQMKSWYQVSLVRLPAGCAGDGPRTARPLRFPPWQLRPPRLNSVFLSDEMEDMELGPAPEFVLCICLETPGRQAA